MGDARSARKAAEKAARDLIGGPLIAAVGDLGEAVTAQQDAAAAVTTAQIRAAELVAAAKRDGAALLAAARADVEASDQAYAAAHTAALDAGWAPKALTDLGYPAPSKRTRTERTPTAAAQPALSANPAAKQ